MWREVRGVLVKIGELKEWLGRDAEARIAMLLDVTALAGARKVAERIDEGVIVFVVCDYGWKYLSTGAWTLDLDEAVANAEKVIYF